MWNTLSFVVENLGISFENLLLLLVVVGGLVFFAKDFRLGTIILFLFSGGLSLWFYNSNMNYINPLVVTFICLVVLVFTLMSQNNNSASLL